MARWRISLRRWASFYRARIAIVNMRTGPLRATGGRRPARDRRAGNRYTGHGRPAQARPRRRRGRRRPALRQHRPAAATAGVGLRWWPPAVLARSAVVVVVRAGHGWIKFPIDGPVVFVRTDGEQPAATSPETTAVESETSESHADGDAANPWIEAAQREGMRLGDCSAVRAVSPDFKWLAGVARDEKTIRRVVADWAQHGRHTRKPRQGVCVSRCVGARWLSDRNRRRRRPGPNWHVAAGRQLRRTARP